jgi:hypothetical protein
MIFNYLYESSNKVIDAEINSKIYAILQEFEENRLKLSISRISWISNKSESNSSSSNPSQLFSTPSWSYKSKSFILVSSMSISSELVS